MKAVAVLPALDEAGAVGEVVHGFLAAGMGVVVVDNGSQDDTARRAGEAGARVVHEARRGYGSACLAGIAALQGDPPDVVVFADCDGTIDPADLRRLLRPLADGADVVLGDRRRIERGAMPLPNRAARWACVAMFLFFYGRRIRDVPPLRAIRWDALQRMPLSHPTYGLPVETVAVALRRRMHIAQVPVGYRVRRGGKSKVGVGLIDALRVGAVIAATTVKQRFRRLP